MHARALEIVRALRPLTGERTTLPVLGHRTAPNGGVAAGQAPRTAERARGLDQERATRRLDDALAHRRRHSRRRVTVYQDGRPVRTFKAVVGKPSTPTPRGEFFVEEAISCTRGDVGAPFALALSARSDVLQEFDGGPGQIALHGLANVGGVLGTAVSHGCIRLDDDAMRWLVSPHRPRRAGHDHRLKGWRPARRGPPPHH